MARKQKNRTTLELARQFEAERLAVAAASPPSRVRRTAGAKWPMVSVNAGCNPDQVEEGNRRIKERGLVGNEYLPNGDVVHTSQRAQREFLKSIGFKNKADYFR